MPRMAKTCKLPRDLRKTVTASIGGTTKTHNQGPLNIMHQRHLPKLRAPDGKERAFTDGSGITINQSC